MKIETRYDLAKLINSNKYKTGVEIGVAEGYFSFYLLKHSKLKTLYSVDPWANRHGENNYKNAKSLLEPYGARSVMIKDYSENVAREFTLRGQQADFVYIDGNHRHSAVTNDIAWWWPRVAPGGILAGHDYVDAKGCGVISGVNDFVKRNLPLTLHLTREYLRTWYVFKPEIDEEKTDKIKKYEK